MKEQWTEPEIIKYGDVMDVTFNLSASSSCENDCQ